MKYLLLIYGDEQACKPEEMEAEMGEYWAFGDEVAASGGFVAAEALMPTATASTVKVRNGKAQTTHGPFAETKEQLGGFYLVDAPDLDQAIAWAAKIPGARSGSVEVRPVADMGEHPA